MQHQEIYNNECKNIRLDIFLLEYLKDTSRTKIQKLINDGIIKVDEFIVKPSYKLKGKEYISIQEFSNVEKNHFIEKQNIPLDILYEDEYMLALNKKSGIVVHPGAGNKNGTLLNGLVYHYDKLSSINNSRPGIIHRLDKETSGVMLVAKSDKSHFLLSEQFAKRKIIKTYRAITWGNINNEGIIEGCMQRDVKNRIKFNLNDKIGKFSLTKYTKINSYDPFSYVELYPKTGRTHQIRVHLKSIGYPIILDELYGGGEKMINSYNQKYSSLIKQVFSIMNRFALHAYKIKFIHPITKNDMEIEAPIPKDFLNVLRLLS